MSIYCGILRALTDGHSSGFPLTSSVVNSHGEACGVVRSRPAAARLRVRVTTQANRRGRVALVLIACSLYLRRGARCSCHELASCACGTRTSAAMKAGGWDEGQSPAALIPIICPIARFHPHLSLSPVSVPLRLPYPVSYTHLTLPTTPYV